MIRTMNSCILMMLVLVPGVWSRDWKVTVENQCALKGTNVVMKCQYDYPYGHTVTSVSWYKAQLAFGKNMLFPLSRLPSPPNFEYVGNYQGDCDLVINDVQPTDEGRYYFHFKTQYDKWRSKAPAHLSVRELTTLVQPSTVTEGDSVSLTCVSGCPKPETIVWFKDGLLVQKPVFQAKREDAGRYYCALLGQEFVRSVPVALNVHYAPKKVTLSVYPSGDILKGSSVTFTCSSNLDQSGYSLYKDGQFVSSGQSHTISDILPSHSGLYYCQASSNISRSGDDLINSTEVHVDVQYPPINVAVSMDPPHVVEGSSVNLTCSCAANPAAHNYTWYKRTDSPGSTSLLQVGSGQVLSLLSTERLHTGLYLCQALNRFGENKSSEVLLTIGRKEHGVQPLPVLAGIGVCLFVTFVVAFFLFWRKRRSHAEKEQPVFDVCLNGRDSTTSARDVEPDTVYAKILMFPSSPPPVATAQDLPSPLQRSPNHNHDVSTFCEDGVIYSAVTVKPRHPHVPCHINNTTQQNTCSKVGENDSSIIYATVANFR